MFGFLRRKFKYEETHEPDMPLEGSNVSLDDVIPIMTPDYKEWEIVKTPYTKVLKDGTEKVYDRISYVCANCGKKSATKTNFCPMCGQRCKEKINLD